MALTTTITADKLATRIGTQDQAEAARCLSVAVAELERATAAAFRDIPAATMDDMVLAVGQAVFDRRRTASGGAAQLAVDGSQQLPRSPRDPLASVRPILAQYVVEL